MQVSLYLPFSSDQSFRGKVVLCLKNTWKCLTKKISVSLFFWIADFFLNLTNLLILFLLRKLVLSNIDDDILNKGHAFAKCTVHTYLLLNFAHEVLVCCMITEICIMSRFFFELAKNDFYYNVLCPQICQTPTASKIQASTRTKNPYAISTSLQYFKLKFWKRGLDRTLGYPLPPKCIFTSDDLYFLKDSNCNAMCAMQ